MTISRDEYLMGRDKIAPLTVEMEMNLTKLLACLNKLRTIYGKPMEVSSGYRPPQINNQVQGAAKRSNHMKCLACDFKDPDGSLAKWCLLNLKVLEDCSLWMEAPSFTVGWVHLQAVPPRSGNRIFKP